MVLEVWEVGGLIDRSNVQVLALCIDKKGLPTDIA